VPPAARAAAERAVADTGGVLAWVGSVEHGPPAVAFGGATTSLRGYEHEF
jgi:hypothetical protein